MDTTTSALSARVEQLEAQVRDLQALVEEHITKPSAPRQLTLKDFPRDTRVRARSDVRMQSYLKGLVGTSKGSRGTKVIVEWDQDQHVLGNAAQNARVKGGPWRMNVDSLELL